MIAGEVVSVAVASLAMAVFGIVGGLFFLGIDRKVSAHMQARIGPPIRQPFRDVRKLLIKESVVPENAVPLLFNLAPVMAVASAITILLYIPVGGMPPVLGGYGDLILILSLLTVPALAMVVGGFASGSPYATVGAQREMVTMIAYEFPLAVAIIAIAWRLSAAGIPDPFFLVTLTSTPIWSVVGPPGIAGCLILLLVLSVVTPAELSLVPFDSCEAATELAGGLLVEYSGRNLAMFSLAQGVKTVVMAALAVGIFLPWNLSALAAVPAAYVPLADFVFFLAKVLLVILFAVTLLRTAVARFRINQIVSLYWFWLGAASIAGLALIVADALLPGVI
ncbi:MAG TPA: NADH-quinone oxidoreductase subunit H [Methanofollis liminatans]|uniref:NADH-quinone oxidoreductase subunit H n=1 Tax=Methanofollis liminatans TaxID=2201 RepID=A0A831PTG2_9EURY|nr:NADH-quinone oxidoreductase subunit H [Methanofollis liminatans]